MRAVDAWKAIEAPFSKKVEDGGFEGEAKPGDAAITVYAIRVQNAYFFPHKLGRALLVVQASPREPYFRDRIVPRKLKMRRAFDFIQKRYPTILVKVGRTGCGQERSDTGVAKMVNHNQVAQTLWYSESLYNDSWIIEIALHVQVWQSRT